MKPVGELTVAICCCRVYTVRKWVLNYGHILPLFGRFHGSHLGSVVRCLLIDALRVRGKHLNKHRMLDL